MHWSTESVRFLARGGCFAQKRVQFHGENSIVKDKKLHANLLQAAAIGLAHRQHIDEGARRSRIAREARHGGAERSRIVRFEAVQARSCRRRRRKPV